MPLNYNFIVIVLLLFISTRCLAFDLADLKDSKKVSLLIAGPKGIGQSLFGHAYLRFSRTEISSQDFVVEIVANEEEVNLNSFSAVLKGIGLTEKNFKSKIVVENFQTVKYEMTILKNRWLKTIPLKLSAEKVSAIVNVINDNKIEIENNDYLFFSKNCSTKISDVVDLAISFSGSTFQSRIPTLLENRYASIIDFEKIEIDEPASDLRKKAIAEHFPKELINHKHPLLMNIVEQISSPYYNMRSYAALKILTLKKIDASIPENVIREARSYLLISTATEQRNNSSEIQRALTSRDLNFMFITLANSFDDYPLKHADSTIDEVTNYELILDKNSKVKIRYHYSYSANKDVQSKQVSFVDVPAENFGFYLEKSQLMYRAPDSSPIEVGYIYKTKIFLARAKLLDIAFFAEIVRGKQWDYLLPVAVIESDKNKTSGLIQNSKSFEPTDSIPLKNFSSGIGNCAALVAIQRALFEQSYFLPGEKPLDPSSNLQILRDVIAGKFVFIPGYENINQWFSSLDQAMVKKLVTEVSYKINVRGFTNLVERYFTRAAIDGDNIQDVQLALSMNYIIPMRFKVDGSSQEHVILVTEILDRGTFFELGIYDANLGGLLPAGLEGLNDRVRFKIDKTSWQFSQETYSKGTKIFIDPESLISHAIYIRAKSSKFINRIAMECLSKGKTGLTRAELERLLF